MGFKSRNYLPVQFGYYDVIPAVPGRYHIQYQVWYHSFGEINLGDVANFDDSCAFRFLVQHESGDFRSYDQNDK